METVGAIWARSISLRSNAYVSEAAQQRGTEASASERDGTSSSTLRYSLDIYKLSKHFRRQTIGKGSYTTLKSALLGLFSRKSTAPQNVTTAIDDLTIRIPTGASVGVIGRNGSGKSSLLKLITGIYKPDTGRISIRGRIAALIELGAGFHPDFTGRENVYLGGVMHGLTRAEIDERFDDIARFAELEHVIDDPVRTYSSGMFMRLGFSLAIHTDPDILLIDEVLAVGDAAFVAKCKERLTTMRKAGKTLVLVSHDLDAIERWCDEVVWLHRGKVMDRGHPRRVIDHYREFIERGEEEELREAVAQQETIETEDAPVDPDEKESGDESGLAPETMPPEAPGNARIQERWGSREIEIVGVDLVDASGTSRLLYHPQDSLGVVVRYLVREQVDGIVFGIGIQRSDGLQVFGSNTDLARVTLPALRAQGELRFDISRLSLLDGHYTLDVAVHRTDGYPFDYRKAALTFAVRSPLRHVGVFEPIHTWTLDGTALIPKETA